MEGQILFVAQALFWTGALFCLVAPLRLAIPGMVILSLVNPSGPAFASATEVGVANALRIVGIPTLLLVRLGLRPILRASWSRMPRAWLYLFVLAALASLWTAYPLSAMKMLGYFYAHGATFVLFGMAWLRGWLHPRLFCLFIWAALLLAVLQSFVLGNLYGGEAQRFTAFVSPQGYAAFLLCALAILVFHRNKSLAVWISIAGAAAGIVLSGSRYVFAGLAALAIIASAAKLLEPGRRVKITALAWRGVIGLVVAVLLFVFVGRYLPESRTAQLVDALRGRSSLTEDIGTFAWRLGVYEATIDELSRRSVGRLLFGSGTSSGANLILDIDSNYHPDTVDANRVLHNEFLRVTYEWGLIGLAMFLGFLGKLLLRAGRAALTRRLPSALSVVGIMPALVAALAIENVLAGAASATGVGFALVLAYGFPPTAPREKEARLNRISPVGATHPAFRMSDANEHSATP